MKRIFALLSAISILFMLITIPVSARNIGGVEVSESMSPSSLKPFIMAQNVQSTTVLNSLGDTVTNISFLERYYFQIWQTYTNNRWYDYVGEFWNEIPEFDFDTLAGRVRPFGNTKLNIGSTTGDDIDGYYYPFSYLDYVSTLTFDFGFNIKDLWGSGNFLPPEVDLTGYLYLFYIGVGEKEEIDPDTGEKVLINYPKLTYKNGYPVTYTFDYNTKTDTALYRCSIDVNIDRYKDFDRAAIGFIPMFTFHQLDLKALDGSSPGLTRLFFPFFNIKAKYLYQQKLLADLESFQNGPSSIIDSDNLSGKAEILSGHLEDFVGSQSGQIKVAQQDASKAIGKHIDSVLSLSALFNLFLEIGFIKDIVLVSMTLGVIAVMLNVVVSSAGNVSGFVKRESKRRKD